jgi:hypothetical protein
MKGLKGEGQRDEEANRIEEATDSPPKEKR